MANQICTYFLLTGAFDPADATRALALTPDSTWRAGDLRTDGTVRARDGWLYGLQEGETDCIEIPLMRTLYDLLPKLERLNRFACEQEVRLILRAEVTVHPGEIPPDLSPTTDIMLFCVRTDADLDIVLHVEP